MYLIYVSARHTPDDDEFNPQEMPQDLQPIMLALNCDNHEYLLREASSQGRDIPKPGGCEEVDRVFFNLRETETSEDDESENFNEIVEEGQAQLAVALATVFFDKGSTKPKNSSFSRYVCERSRIADRVVVAGYTDRNCSLAESERIGLERAKAVRKVLEEDGINQPVVAISRPATAYAKKTRWSRRVEVAALFFNNQNKGNNSNNPETDPKGGKGNKPTKKKYKPVRSKTINGQNGSAAERYPLEKIVDEETEAEKILAKHTEGV